MAKIYDVENKENIILRDYLARDRTVLALERTVLAYVRTALGLFSAGFALIKIVPDIPTLFIVGLFFLISSPIVLGLGIVRFYSTKKRIDSIPNNHLLKDEREIWDERHKD